MRKLFHISLSLFLSLGLIIPTVGCQSTTTLVSSDPSAEIQVENSKAKGELEWRDKNSMFRSLHAQVSKPGCKPQNYSISRMDEFDPSGFFLGFVTYGVGFLWAGKYRPEYQLVYRCEPLAEGTGK